MRFLPDERLYSHTEDCLQFLRNLNGSFDSEAPRTPECYHLFSLKQAFAVKSFLATQDLKNSELWLWLDVESGYADYQENPFLQPLLPFLHVKCFDPEAEVRNTPLEQRPDLYDCVRLASRSDFFRQVVLYKYGGTYADMDIMFLRDVGTLLRDGYFHSEFCYRWSAHLPYGNSAVLRLRQHRETARALLVKCGEVGSCHPMDLLRFEDNVDLNLLILPCSFFDPLWPHHDRADNNNDLPFDRFKDFFRGFGWRFRHNSAIRSYREFFPGAFTYHWHNFWDAREKKESYFGLFNREFEIILREKLGSQITGRQGWQAQR